MLKKHMFSLFFLSLLSPLSAERVPLQKTSSVLESLYQGTAMAQNNYFLSSLLLLALVIILILYIWHLRRQLSLSSVELDKGREKTREERELRAVFLGNMSHATRTSMNAILGFTEQLEKSEHDPSHQKMFQTIKNSLDTLVHIMDNVLDISKIEHDKAERDIQAYSLHILCKEIEKHFECTTEEKEVSFVMRLEESVPSCAMLDEVRLKQVILSLIANALVCAPSKSTITLDIGLNKEAQRLEILITDMNTPIGKEDHEKIFNLFEQKDNTVLLKYSNIGLELSICKKLIDIMQGHIYLKSSRNGGNKFIIDLPYIECDDKALIQNSAEESFDPGLLKGRVLVVEDNKTDQVLIGVILDEFRIDYDIANNGKEAVDMFNQNRYYSLILMDESMPFMSGSKATEHIRKIEGEKVLNPVSIIAVTANALVYDKRRLIESGMDDYITKPYTQKAIKAMLFRYMT